jgi:hypothetical protein
MYVKAVKDEDKVTSTCKEKENFLDKIRKRSSSSSGKKRGKFENRREIRGIAFK